MSHRIKFERSFADALEKLKREDPQAEAEWNEIVEKIKDDPLFTPEDPPISFEQDWGKGVCSCQHISGWRGWALCWLYELHPRLREPVSVLTVYAERAPQTQLKPKKRG